VLVDATRQTDSGGSDGLISLTNQQSLITWLNTWLITWLINWLISYLTCTDCADYRSDYSGGRWRSFVKIMGPNQDEILNSEHSV